MSNDVKAGPEQCQLNELYQVSVEIFCPCKVLNFQKVQQ